MKLLEIGSNCKIVVSHIVAIRNDGEHYTIEMDNDRDVRIAFETREDCRAAFVELIEELEAI